MSFKLENGSVTKIRDPKDPNVIIDDPKEIKDVLTEYWSSLGRRDAICGDDDQLNKLGQMTPNPDSLHSIVFDDDSNKLFLF